MDKRPLAARPTAAGRAWQALLFVVLCGVNPSPGWAQGPRAPVAGFQSGVRMVTLHVTVTDRKKHYVTDLAAEDFQVFEDGRPQPVAFFQPAGLPLALTLILDTSQSVRHVLPAIKAAAAGFLEELEAGDIASVIAFDSRVAVLQEFTADRTRLAAAIARAKQGETTSVYTAMYVALRELQRAARHGADKTPRRRVVVLLSDGDDNSSLLTFDDLFDEVMRSDAAIYAIRLGPPLPPRSGADGEFVLRRLTEQTGGRAIFVASASDLPRAYQQIRRELASQYSLAYVSPPRPKTDGVRNLAVLISRAGAIARTKRGYLAGGR